MKQIISLTILLVLSFITAGCGTIKEGFSSQKKNTTEEFLVEKRSPLVLPPNFNDLPTPKTKNEKLEDSSSDIENLINVKNQTLQKTETISNKENNLENSILDKINKN